MRPLGFRDLEHSLGEVEADDLGGAGLGDVKCELAGAATNVEGTSAGHVREERDEGSVLVGRAPVLAESLEQRVAREELRVIVDVLRLPTFRVGHSIGSKSPVRRSYRLRRGASPSVPGAGLRSSLAISMLVAGNTAWMSSGPSPALAVPCGTPAGTKITVPAPTRRRSSPSRASASPSRIVIASSTSCVWSGIRSPTAIDS